MIERTWNCRNLKLIRYYCNNSAQWTLLTHEESGSFEACFCLVEYLVEGKLRSRVNSFFVPKDCQLHTTTPGPMAECWNPFCEKKSFWRLELHANFIPPLYNTHRYRNMSYISTLHDSYTAVHLFVKQTILGIIDQCVFGWQHVDPSQQSTDQFCTGQWCWTLRTEHAWGPHMFARALSGCFCSFCLCFHEVGSNFGT